VPASRKPSRRTSGRFARVAFDLRLLTPIALHHPPPVTGGRVVDNQNRHGAAAGPHTCRSSGRNRSGLCHPGRVVGRRSLVNGTAAFEHRSSYRSSRTPGGDAVPDEDSSASNTESGVVQRPADKVDIHRNETVCPPDKTESIAEVQGMTETSGTAGGPDLQQTRVARDTDGKLPAEPPRAFGRSLRNLTCGCAWLRYGAPDRQRQCE
jgi:hypothetical protein